MALTDFLDFEPFNQLRTKMNANSLGDFELFDPHWHLTGIERSQLERDGITASASQLHMLLDFTLVFKNSRVLVIDKHYYHVACCDRLFIQAEYQIATSLRSMQLGKVICPDCLQRLNYDGYDRTKARREAYSEKVLDSFQLSAFWKHYPMYPVSEKKEMRKPLQPSAVT